jgi:hypothetical protein
MRVSTRIAGPMQARTSVTQDYLRKREG